MGITVLRLGHRPIRDKRVTTHLFLAARAFGADRGIYSGVKDRGLEETLARVCLEWGGSFRVEYAESWRKVVKEWSGKVVHLTMYGVPFRDVIPAIRDDSAEKLIIVGGEKVPSEAYSLADWNVSVTSQPHSEVSALALFLHEYFEGQELDKKFDGARLRVVPQERGKKVVTITSP